MEGGTKPSQPGKQTSGSSQYGTFNPAGCAPNSPLPSNCGPTETQAGLTSEVKTRGDSLLDTFNKYIGPYLGETWFNVVLISAPVLVTYLFTYFGVGLGGSLFLAYFVAKLFQESLSSTYLRKVQKIQSQLLVPELENDIESVSWMNQFLKCFWLQFEPHLSKQICTGVEAALVEYLPGFITSAKFMSFTLGTKAPLIEGVKFYPREESDIIIMDWTVSFTPHAHHSGIDPEATLPNLDPLITLHVALALGPIKATIPVAVSHTRFHACLRVKMRLMNAFPHIQSIDVALLELPQVDLSLRPIDPLGWDFTNIPGFWTLVNRQIYLVLSEMLLAPKVFTVDVESIMSGGLDSDSAIGVLKLTVANARNLKNIELLGMIDPFVSVNIEGRKQLVRTRTIDNTKEPVWDETFTILLYNIGETLNLVVKDENGMKKDHTLGTCSLSLASLIEEPQQEHCSKLSVQGKSRGELTYRLSYFPVAEPLKLEDGTEEPVQSNSGILKLFIRQVSGLEKQKKLLPVGGKSKLWVEVQNNGKPLVTTPHAEVSNRIVLESVSEHFIDSLSDSSLRLVLHSTGSSLGSLSIRLESLLNHEETLKKEGWFDVTPSGPSGPSSANPLKIKLDGKWSPVLVDPESHGTLPLPFGFVRVVVKQAKDLKTVDLVGKSDPSVTVVMSNKVWGRTPSQENSTNPVWDSVFYIPVHRAKERIRFEVKGQSALKARNLGEMELAVADLFGGKYESKVGFQDGPLQEGWYSLGDKSRGNILLSSQFFSLVPDALPTKESSTPDQASDTIGETSGSAEPGEVANPTTELTELTEPTELTKPSLDLTKYNSGIIRITAVEARGVGSSRSKLYVLALLNGDERTPVLRTRVFKGSSAPVWGESGEGFVKEVDVDTLTITVRELRDGEDKVLGTWESKLQGVVQELAAAASQPETTEDEAKWYNFNGNIGSIQLKFHFSPTLYQIDPVESARNRGVLQARVVQAENLKGVDKDGSSDPYVALSLNQAKKVQTKVRKNDCNPHFDQLFSFKVLDRINSTMRIEVFDWNQIQSHTSLGFTEIHLKDLEVESLVRQAFPLTNAESGSVTLELLFAPMYVFNEVSSGLLDAALSGNPIDLVGGLAKGGFSLAKGTGMLALGGASSLASGGAHLAGGAISTAGKLGVGGAKLAGEGAKTVLTAPLKLASSGAGLAKGLFGKKDRDAKSPSDSVTSPYSNMSSLHTPSIHSSITTSPQPESAHLPGSGSLKVVVVEAKDLKAADRNGYSDPYIKITRDNKLLLKTKVIKKTLSPVWEESFTLTSVHPSDPLELRVQIKDHNTFGENLDLGEWTLNPWNYIQDPSSGAPIDVWTQEGSIQNGSGSLHFKLEFLPAVQTIPISPTGSDLNPETVPQSSLLGVLSRPDTHESDYDSNPVSASNSHDDRQSLSGKSTNFFGSLRKKLTKN